MLNSSSISLFSMSVLKKNQFADAPMAIIGAGAAECQKPVRITNVPCSTAAR
jgi:hypothetical protein